jgi:hypothetical protein
MQKSASNSLTVLQVGRSALWFSTAASPFKRARQRRDGQAQSIAVVMTSALLEFASPYRRIR